MGEEFEFDTGEHLAELREHQRLTGTEPQDEAPSGMTRRIQKAVSGTLFAELCETGRLPR